MRPFDPATGPRHGRWKGDDVGYLGAHCRVHRHRGKASSHTCMCGEPAREWAYDHLDPNEKVQATGRFAGKPYSPDPSHYVPTCKRCHSLADRNRGRVA